MGNPFEQALVGVIWFFNRERGQATVKVDAKNGTVDVGGQTADGRIRVNDQHDRTAFILDANTRTLDVLDEAGNVKIRFDGRTGNILHTGEVRAASLAAV